MIKYINSILTSNNSHNTTYKWLIAIAIIYTGVKLAKLSKPLYVPVEGFTQSKPYVYKKNKEVYDDFTADIYDELHNTKNQTDWELAQIIRLTSPDVNPPNHTPLVADAKEPLPPLLAEVKSPKSNAFPVVDIVT